ncbi:hypothetical protein GQ53DRAFT_644785 [Thozetella sp. PMI_491]|nr:hypothetical protein GQ53DRAFT_644785 [Thozetella sp. PMI_491]
MSSIRTQTAPKPAASGRPSLALSTPVTANFPREAMSAASEAMSARSDKTPLSAVSVSSCFRDAVTAGGLPSAGLPSAGLHSAGLSPFPGNGPASARLKAEEAKTPITPPMAYTDFLRSMSLASPSLASPPPTGKNPLNRTSTTGSTGSNGSSDTAASDEADADKDESAPSTAVSEATDVSCKCDHKHKTPHGKREGVRSPRPAAINTAIPPGPLAAAYPLSAPAAGPSAAGFPSLAIPPSPAPSNAGGMETPLSARTPFSARSVRSPFDWEAALKGARFGDPTVAKTGSANALTSPLGFAVGQKRDTKRDSRSTIRHIREVVTRTVTYTPRMGPAPKGKRRKVDHETAVES